MTRPLAWLAALAFACLAAILIDGNPASANVAALLALPGHDAWLAELLHTLRVPRVLAAAGAGALLATAGSAVQLLFRNPLAEPGLIGVSGGAALAAALGLSVGAGAIAVAGSAFAGGLGALLIARQLCGRDVSGSRLILAGVAVNALAGSLLTLLIATLPDGDLRNVTFWLMGSFAAMDWAGAAGLLAAIAPVWLLLRLQASFLNALQLGEAAAFHVGFAVARRLQGVAVLAALATALVVSAVGMIGFVGLLAPHLARLLVGAESRRLMTLAPLLGALLTVLADWVARLALAPAELPVGVVTSLIGAPFFLWLLNKQGGRGDARA
ncbi:iron complex transport system permease protein [Crenobacter luteus]|uniref:FecCD family ABC transporter permease n=1 Tax=Crenobacter luteus TaxID=1452487 RepID=UPI001052FADA|nr:iron ABC transporter permease [Crenobacter luteus]TCP14539.1 iron complex transport system permease protein [Crenobacter luteus]